MTWTTESKTSVLLRQPWTIRVREEGGDRTLTIDELPEFIMVFSANEATGAAEKEFWSALRTTLRSYLEHGDLVPLPRPTSGPLPWEEGGRSPQPRRRMVLRVNRNGSPAVVEEVDEPVAL